jgi:hypothetical protein
MNPRGRIWLLLGAFVSLAIGVLHVIIVIIGPPAYSFFSGEQGEQRLAQLVATGSFLPAVMTLLLALVHTVFGIYGLSGAGLIRRLPLLPFVLLIIGGYYAFRGLSIVDQALQILADPGSLPLRVLFYSVVSLVTGCAYIVGTVKGLGWLQDPEDPNKFSA